jgi:radical SAM protein with 4Fe4S-binding SPASM domain
MNIYDILENNKAPAYVIFEPTINCNLKCPMCDRTHKEDFKKHMERQLPSKLTVNFLKSLGEMGVKNVLLIGGGEPLMHHDINEFIGILKDSGISVHLWTNGTLINRKNVKFLTENCDMITISMDSPHEKINDTSRGVKGISKKVKQSLRLLYGENTGCYLRIHCVISALNYNHLNDFIPFLKEFHINEFGGGIINPYAFVPDYFKIPEKDKSSIEKKIKNFGTLARNEGITLAGCFNTILKNHISEIKAQIGTEKGENVQPSITCLGLWSQATVRPNGDVSICCFTYKPILGNLNEMTFFEIWNSERANKLRELVKRGEYIDKPCIGCDLGHPIFINLIQKEKNLNTFYNMLINSR